MNVGSLNKPLPEQGDKVFLDTEDGSEAWVSAISPSFYAYATAYRASAELLIEHKRSLSSLDENFQILPIAYLYRQHIELLLKAIIKNGDELQGTERMESNLHHRLDDLWNVVEQVIEENIQDVDYDSKLATSRLISELAEADPGSFVFRYPIGKKGEINLEDWRRVSLDNFDNVMAKLSNFLLGVLFELYQAESHS